MAAMKDLRVFRSRLEKEVIAPTKGAKLRKRQEVNASDGSPDSGPGMGRRARLVYHLPESLDLSLVPFKKGRLRGGPSRIGARGAYLTHSTRFLTRPVSRIFAAFASEGLP
jgi:hypothetical protein